MVLSSGARPWAPPTSRCKGGVNDPPIPLRRFSRLQRFWQVTERKRKEERILTVRSSSYISVLGASVDEFTGKQVPGFIIHEFQRPASRQATVLQYRSHSNISQRSRTDKLLESFHFAFDPGKRLFGNRKLFHSLCEAFRSHAAYPALPIGGSLRQFRRHCQILIHSIHNTINGSRKINLSLSLAHRKQRFALMDLLPNLRQNDFVNASNGVHNKVI